MTTSRSEDIQELAKALALAQGVIGGAVKDSSNPFFKSSYADLASVWDAIRKPLSANGLSVVQMPSADGPKVTITTLMLHSSGQWISSDLTVTAKEDTPQAIGSAITYARRYALQSIAGVAPEDDDGERAQGRTTPMQTQRRPNPTPADDSMHLLTSIREALNGIAKQFSDAGHAQAFHECLGAAGYENMMAVPPNRGLAQELVKTLKLRLADLVGSELNRPKANK